MQEKTLPNQKTRISNIHSGEVGEMHIVLTIYY